MEPVTPQPKIEEPKITRPEAWEMLNKYLTNVNLIKHSLAAEAAMRALYNKFYFGKPEYNEEEKEVWGITGLLHDADYQICKGEPEMHGKLLFEKEPHKMSVAIINAIQAHNPATNIEPKSIMAWSIRCCDQLTGLIVAATLIHPDKKLASITPEFVLKRMDEKSFAKGADRTQIKFCQEKLQIPLPEFVSIVLTAMQGISQDLGL